MSAGFKIQLDGIERVKQNGGRDDFYQLNFKTVGRVVEFEFPILVAAGDYADTDAVRVGKSYLANSLAKLAELTNEWVLTEDERNSLRLPQKEKPR